MIKLFRVVYIVEHSKAADILEDWLALCRLSVLTADRKLGGEETALSVGEIRSLLSTLVFQEGFLRKLLYSYRLMAEVTKK